jgi:hypothetical protein
MQKELAHSAAKSECGFFFDEKFCLRACVERIDKRYSLKENGGDWLALAVFCDKVFQYAELFEYQSADKDGFSLYKRTSYLAEMVGKSEFMKTLTQACCPIKTVVS